MFWPGRSRSRADCARDAQRTHFRFTPNQVLSAAGFRTLCSCRRRPARSCRVHRSRRSGTKRIYFGLRVARRMGGGESSLGYCLVARPTTAMYDAVERAASLVASPTPASPDSRGSRGTAFHLKRLSSGGSQSRGNSVCSWQRGYCKTPSVPMPRRRGSPCGPRGVCSLGPHGEPRRRGIGTEGACNSRVAKSRPSSPRD